MSLALQEAQEALRDVLIPLLPAGRVHLHAPDQLVAPCAWIGRPSIELDESLALGTYPVTLVADGNPTEQARLLLVMVSTAWSMLAGPYRPVRATPGTVDAGAGRVEELRSYTLDVEVLVDAVTFCPPTLATTPAWPTAVS